VDLTTLFLSRGSPMLAFKDSIARRFLQQLGKTLPRPEAVVVVSAHWESAGCLLAGFSLLPETMHGFGGLPEALFDLQYPARGALGTAARGA
jgi:4,5-DOPA dioxygenase extradiol